MVWILRDDGSGRRDFVVFQLSNPDVMYQSYEQAKRSLQGIGVQAPRSHRAVKAHHAHREALLPHRQAQQAHGIF